MSKPDLDFYTVRDVKRRFNVSERTVRRWLEAGLKHYKTGPGQQGGVRIKRTDVEAWWEARAVGGVS